MKLNLWLPHSDTWLRNQAIPFLYYRRLCSEAPEEISSCPLPHTRKRRHLTLLGLAKKHHLHGSDQSINLSVTNEEIQTWNNTRILLQHTNWCPNIYTGTTFVEIVWTERCSLDRLEIVIRFWTSQKRFQQGLVHFRQPLYRFTQHSLQTKSYVEKRSFLLFNYAVFHPLTCFNVALYEYRTSRGGLCIFLQ